MVILRYYISMFNCIDILFLCVSLLLNVATVLDQYLMSNLKFSF